MNRNPLSIFHLALVVGGSLLVMMVAMVMANLLTFHDFYLWQLTTFAKQLQSLPKPPINLTLLMWLLGIGYLLPLCLMTGLKLIRPTMPHQLIPLVSAAAFISMSLVALLTQSEIDRTLSTWGFFGLLIFILLLGSLAWTEAVLASHRFDVLIQRWVQATQAESAEHTLVKWTWVLWAGGLLAVAMGGERLAEPLGNVTYVLLVITAILKLKRPHA